MVDRNLLQVGSADIRLMIIVKHYIAINNTIRLLDFMTNWTDQFVKMSEGYLNGALFSQSKFCE